NWALPISRQSCMSRLAGLVAVAAALLSGGLASGRLPTANSPRLQLFLDLYDRGDYGRFTQTLGESNDNLDRLNNELRAGATKWIETAAMAERRGRQFTAGAVALELTDALTLRLSWLTDRNDHVRNPAALSAAIHSMAQSRLAKTDSLEHDW